MGRIPKSLMSKKLKFKIKWMLILNVQAVAKY